MTELLDVGLVTKPHGLRGDVIVKLTTNRVERLNAGSVLQTDRGPMTVVSAAPHQHGWLVRFHEIGSREEAEAARGLVLRAEPLDVPGQLWVHELVGSEVVDVSGVVLGQCLAVEANPASDLLVLDGGILIPLHFVVSHSAAERRVTVDPPAGLMEL